jgi:hypothetical protein
MLDYAANGVVYWPIEQLRKLFARQCERDGRESEKVVAGLPGRTSGWSRSGSTPGIARDGRRR